MFRGYRLTPFYAAASLALSACASEVPREAPTQIAEAVAGWPGSVWQAPSVQPVSLTPPRASSFTGPLLLREPFYSNEQLRRNFLSIAMRAEAADDVDIAGNIPVSKWTKPLRYQLIGATPSDVKRLNALAIRLRNLLNLDIAPAVAETPNVRINFVPFHSRYPAVANLAAQVPLGPANERMALRWRDAEGESCLGFISMEPRNGAIARADIYIKDELPERIRNACIVEEFVQSLGLMNDDPRARPSIFNDSQEFLELTSHDEYLLRILYDRRVRPGMRVPEMNPLVDQIIREVRPITLPSETRT